MVSFSCEVCNDTLVKKKLMGHFGRCPNAYFTCIDCNTTFQGTEFQKHTQCISEDQKYQGKLYQPKAKQPQKPAAQPEPVKAKETKLVEEPEAKTSTSDKKEKKEKKDKKEKSDKKSSESKLLGPVKIEKAQSLKKTLKLLAKKHNLDSKEISSMIKVTADGTLVWE